MNSHPSNISPYLKIFMVVVMTATNFGFFHIAKAEIPFNCEDLTTPDKTQGYIITILEEAIATGNEPMGGQAGENVLNCFRVTEKTGDAIKSSYSQSCPDASKCKRTQVFFDQSGAELLYSYVGRIYRWGAGTIGIVSVLFIVWGGVEIASAGADSGKIEKAKERIMQSIAGLVILFLSALILYTINPNFFTK